MVHPRFMEDDNSPARIPAVATWEYPAKFYSTPGGSSEGDARTMLLDAVAKTVGTDLPAGMDRPLGSFSSRARPPICSYRAVEVTAGLPDCFLAR
ncbi:MAG: hypothetical protein ABI137_12950 [Antricoccus sp.]